MSAETLREAARLMRERADGATEGTGAADWFVAGLGAVAGTQVRSSGGTVAQTSGFEAHHIASWHPGVALAVADVLDVAAVDFDNGYMEGDDLACDAALAVARAYLGAAS